MTKVSITIDDKDPKIVAIFGENSINNIADLEGYTPIVAKDEAELPAKIAVVVPDPVTGEDIITQEYPEGTELYKENPETKASFVGKSILKKAIIPRLLAGFKQVKTQEVTAQMNEALKQVEEMLESVAVIEVKE